MSHEGRETFDRSWSAKILQAAPMIAPARQFLYPRLIAGEEDALSRGALQMMVRPTEGAEFLATCALGFTDASMPTGVYSCPNPAELCAVAGGYAYVIDTTQPERCTHLKLRPVVEVHTLITQQLLLFVGFHSITAWGRDDLAWESGRLSWEGVRILGVEGGTLRGLGWDLMADRDVEFSLDLATGLHRGGVLPSPQARRS